MDMYALKDILLYTPDIEFLSKQHVVVKVWNGSIHGIAVSHLHHRSTWFTLHKLYLSTNTQIFNTWGDYRLKVWNQQDLRN